MNPTLSPLRRSADLRDRRAANRPSDPACPECKASRVRVVLRTTSGLYYRCDGCGHLLAMQALGTVPTP